MGPGTRWLLFSSLLSISALSCSGGDKGENAGEVEDNSPTDLDHDEFTEEDCNEGDAAIHPEATEVCDGIDNDCDGQVDEGVETTFYADQDDDGFGDADSDSLSCEGSEGLVTYGNDCDDADPGSYPGAEELCDGIDNDCDGDIDEDGQQTWYADTDGDGWGDPDVSEEACSAPEGYVDNHEDCDDTNADNHPGGLEICDEVDNDCDDVVDEGVETTWYEDHDGDGYGLLDQTQEACAPPAGYAAESGDCDDDDLLTHPDAAETDCTDPHDYNCDGSVGYADIDGDGWAACAECDDTDDTVRPDATEVCNGVDDDCNGWTDDADPGLDLSTASTWYDDDDADLYGDPAAATTACLAPGGAVADNTDCDDLETEVNPGAVEVCNGFDDDCDTLIDDLDPDVDTSTGTTAWTDGDGDGYGDPGSAIIACEAPTGSSLDGTDCDDGDGDVHPGATELCNDIDDDCDSLIDDDDSDLELSSATTWYADADTDGYGDLGAPTLACDQPASFIPDSSDCDDGDGNVHPGATETCNSLDDDCDTSVDEGLLGTAAACSAGSCAELLAAGTTTSGSYWLDPDGGGSIAAFAGYCEQSADSGGWTLILKTDASSIAHYTSAAVNSSALSSPTLNTVAKLEDSVVQALQVATAASGEIRVVATGTSDTLIVKGINWSVPKPASYSTSSYARYGSVSTYSKGYQCYDSDMSTNPGCNTDHWCFGVIAGAHTCIRRFASAGLWMNYGIYPAAYYTGSVWVR